ncbi:MAG: SDR family oxidoreductase, partial [Deltaproteobacteria bacterium]|nr:SDR family oxidoreductase [Deltaproteobacteria bacterium]
ITGAAHGLGASHALAFAREGAAVAVTDICDDLPEARYGMGKQEEMTGVVKEIQAMGGRAVGIRCDVRNAGDVEGMVQRVIDEFGKIDILVNNAGIAFVATPLWKVTEAAWDLTVDVMLKGTFLCCKYVLPHMMEQRCGKIVNTGSIGARGQKYNAPYSAVKAGIQVFTLAVAKDVGKYNINVNCVSPGSVYTPMMQGACRDAASVLGRAEEEFYDSVCKGCHILGRGITEVDISNAVLFLCSEEARNVNGHVLYVDGGFLNI